MTARLFDPSKYQRKRNKRRQVKDMPEEEQPLHRMNHVGLHSVSVTELLAICLQTSDGLDMAHEIINASGGIHKLSRLTTAELTAVPGIGPAQASRIRAALELGRRAMQSVPNEQNKVQSPADAAKLLMPEMQDLDQEHLRVILLNTSNGVIGVQTIYIGSLNTSIVRIVELFRPAIRNNAAAIIVAHNHPSGDPAPSPEDVNVTRQIVAAGKLLDIDVLDHVIICRQRYVSLKERGLGFD